MATHYKFYDGLDETVVPFNARYSFPTQSNKANKITSRITPSTGSQAYGPGNVIRINIPAQGYLNPLNTTLEFDVTLYSPTTNAGSMTRFQNNIQSLWSRGRLMYGSNPIEDIPNLGLIIRAVSEWTDGASMLDDESIAKGIGGVTMGQTIGEAGTDTIVQNLVNVRQAFIQGIDQTATGYGIVPNTSQGVITGQPTNGSYCCTRRYQINLPFGMFNQGKLLPMKWMANQFQIELTLAPPQACILVIPQVVGGVVTTTQDATYNVSNINLISEIVEFDASYDVAFLKGLTSGGVPIKYSSWHNYTFAMTSSNLQLIIQEKSRSIKAIFAMMQRAPYSIFADGGAGLFSTTQSAYNAATNNTLIQYQFRAGSRFYPAAPVQTAMGSGTTAIPNGGAEAFIELQKALNTVGDARVKTANSTLRWAQPTVQPVGGATTNQNIATYNVSANELDWQCSAVGYNSNGNLLAYPASTTVATNAALTPVCGNMGSSCFAMATDFETSNGKND